MPTKNSFSVADASAALRRLADPERATQGKRYFQAFPGGYGEGDEFLGVKVPHCRSIAKQCKQPDLEAALELLRSGFHEERFLALLLLIQLFRKGDEATRKRIYETYVKSADCINNWDLIDTSAEYIIGAYLENRSRAPLDKLARSKNLWERRMAMLGTFGYIKQGSFDDALRIAEILLADQEDLIHKAVGWMLRVIGDLDRKRMEEFLLPRYKTMPRTMLRYAIEKLPEPRRKAYLNGNV